MWRFLWLAIALLAGVQSARAEIDTSFHGFPRINVLQPGNPTYNTPLTSDYMQGFLRPKWTRAMTDVGGWPAFYEFKNDIYLEFNLVDGHRGTNAPGATGALVRLRSSDQGNTWERLDARLFGARLYGEYVTKGDTLYRYEWVSSQWRHYVSTSTDGVRFTNPVPAYDTGYILYDVEYHAPSGKFYSTPHFLPTTGAEESARHVRLIESDNGFDWRYVTTLHSGASESETAFHIDGEGSLTALVRQKWYQKRYAVVQGAPPYDNWQTTIGDFSLEGHQFFEVEGQLFVGSRAFLPADLVTGQIYDENLALGQPRQPFTAIYKVGDDMSLTLWAVLDSLGDNSYPRIVATDDEVLVAYYSQHQDRVDKVYLAAFDKDTFLGVHHAPEPSALALACVGAGVLLLAGRKLTRRRGRDSRHRGPAGS